MCSKGRISPLVAGSIIVIILSWLSVTTENHWIFVATIISVLVLIWGVFLAWHKCICPIKVRVFLFGSIIDEITPRIGIRVEKIDLTVRNENKKLAIPWLEAKGKNKADSCFAFLQGKDTHLKICYKQPEGEVCWDFTTRFQNEKELKEYLGDNDGKVRIKIGRIKSNWFDCYTSSIKFVK